MFEAVQMQIGSMLADVDVDLYPAEYNGNIADENKYGRYSIIFAPTERSDFGSGKNVSGYLIVQLFFKTGDGPLVPIQMTTPLNAAFDGPAGEGLSFSEQNLSAPVRDHANDALSMSVWQAAFTKFL